MMEYQTVKPFLSWAGGKVRLLPELRKLYPAVMKKYCEPFIGGVQYCLTFLANCHPDEVLVNDINPDLINLYCHVRDCPDDLIDSLSRMQEEYFAAEFERKRELFELHKREFNGCFGELDDFRRAVLFLYLNKTCFNGLYRVNRSGDFNTSWGKHTHRLICDEVLLRQISSLLRDVRFLCGSYDGCEDFIDADTFTYLDPPYRPISQTASFANYAKNGFDDADQTALAAFVHRIAAKGGTFILSNSDPKNSDPNDNFFDDLYRDFTIRRVHMYRMISCKPSSRKGVSELLIFNR